MFHEPAELTQARRDYLAASATYARHSAHIERTGGTDRTRAEAERARSRLSSAYALYVDVCATAGVRS
jgi:hypothetical protein